MVLDPFTEGFVDLFRLLSADGPSAICNRGSAAPVPLPMCGELDRSLRQRGADVEGIVSRQNNGRARLGLHHLGLVKSCGPSCRHECWPRSGGDDGGWCALE